MNETHLLLQSALEGTVRLYTHGRSVAHLFQVLSFFHVPMSKAGQETAFLSYKKMHV